MHFFINNIDMFKIVKILFFLTASFINLFPILFLPLMKGVPPCSRPFHLSGQCWSVCLHMRDGEYEQGTAHFFDVFY